MEGQFNMAIEEELSWKHSSFEPFSPSASSLFTVEFIEGWPRLLSTLSRSLTPGLSRPTPSSICRSWRAEGSPPFLHRQAPPLAWILALPAPLIVSCPLLQCTSDRPQYVAESTTIHVSLSASSEACVLCYISLSVPFSVFFLPVGSHCIKTLCYKSPSHCKRISFY